MKALIIQHVDYEEPGTIEDWLRDRGISYRTIRLYQGEPIPSQMDFDYLFVMGGPMGVYDEDEYPWLKQEKDFVRRTIDGGKKVVGICLGAQLIAHVLGAKVHSGVCREHGWKPVYLTPAGLRSRLFGGFPPRFYAFHWHSDVFEIPRGAENLARTEDCENQAFRFSNALALQFHLEVTPRIVRSLMEKEGRWNDNYLSTEHFSTAKSLLFKILDRL